MVICFNDCFEICLLSLSRILYYPLGKVKVLTTFLKKEKERKKEDQSKDHVALRETWTGEQTNGHFE